MRNTAHDAVYGVVTLQFNGRRRCAIGVAAIVGHLGRPSIVHLDIRLAVHVCSSRRFHPRHRNNHEKERQITISKESFVAC